jgi:hypothetical protein
MHVDVRQKQYAPAMGWLVCLALVSDWREGPVLLVIRRQQALDLSKSVSRPKILGNSPAFTPPPTEPKRQEQKTESASPNRDDFQLPHNARTNLSYMPVTSLAPSNESWNRDLLPGEIDLCHPLQGAI